MGATQLAFDEKIANIAPLGGLKTGFDKLDKFCKTHTAKTGVLECAFCVVEPSRDLRRGIQD